MSFRRVGKFQRSRANVPHDPLLRYLLLSISFRTLSMSAQFFTTPCSIGYAKRNTPRCSSTWTQEILSSLRHGQADILTTQCVPLGGYNRRQATSAVTFLFTLASSPSTF